MPICQKILNLMNSKVHVDSKVGHGSRFWFDLDLKEVINHTLVSTEVSVDKKIVRNLASPCKVLVVDDNAENRALLVEYLQALGFTLEEAQDGREGIAIAEEFQPDVILVDLMMPVMDGKEMIAAIRQDALLQDTLVVIISAHIQSIRDSSNINSDGFLVKPVDLEQLLKLLEQHLQLDWQPADEELNLERQDEAVDWILPAEDKLVELLELVTSGKMKDLRQQIELLEEIDSQYIPFLERVLQLADNYEQNRLHELLEKLLKQGQ